MKLESRRRLEDLIENTPDHPPASAEDDWYACANYGFQYVQTLALVEIAEALALMAESERLAHAIHTIANRIEDSA